MKRRASAAPVVVLVIAAQSLVHWLAPPSTARADDPPAAASTATAPYAGKLPAHVVDMREQILAAVQSGLIEDLTVAIDWNELRPDFGDAAGSDPIPYWKRSSDDGQGREMLAVLGNILSLAPARSPVGKDPENNAVYVWPYLAELPLDKLAPAEEVDLYRIVPAAVVKVMREKKKWTWWRLAIGADGTWHTFKKSE